MKRIIIFFTMAFLLSFGVNAQTLSTDTFNSANSNLPNIGDNFNVPVDVTGIGEVYTLTVYVEYDNTVLSYTGSTNQIGGVTYTVSNITPSILKIYADNGLPNTCVIPDGKFIDLQFDYLGGYSQLDFGINTDTYKSSIFQLSFQQYYFTAGDVTNGSVGDIDFIIDGDDWNTASNWSSGLIPTAGDDAFVVAGTETTIDAAAVCNNLTIEQGGELTNNSTLDVGGDMLIESDDLGSGSFIDKGTLTVTGTSSAECYVTNGQWHGIASPVSGETFEAMYLGGTPEVWIKEFDEASGTYSDIIDITTPMGDMQGWFTWVETSASPQTFTFEGGLRGGTVGTSNNMLHAGLGHNYVGNAFSSAIDWDATSGWTKTNLYDAIYVYNDDNWAAYGGDIGVNSGSNYVAMSQGFFVQVKNAGTGTLMMDNSVCVHNPVPYLKAGLSELDIIRLEVEDNGLVDETVVVLRDGATTEFDDYDASKFFSFNADYPQIYSTANDFMAINQLPLDFNESVSMDVRGKDGNSLTITATESDDFEELYLRDEYTGVETNLKNESYSFTYDADITNRFTLMFSTTDVNEGSLAETVKIFAANKYINVVLNQNSNANITVYNLMGQEIVSQSANATITRIPVSHTGYYVVKVSDGKQFSSQKVFIK